MRIHSLMDNLTDDLYLSHDFKNVLEDHLTFLKQNKPRMIEVTSHQNYKWEGDFYGLLDELRVPKDFHYVSMRMNGLTNSGHYKGDLDYILIPDINTVEDLKMTFETKNI